MRFLVVQASLLVLAATVDTQRARAEGASSAAAAVPAASAPAPAPSASARASAPVDNRAKCVAEHEESQLARMRESLLKARAAALSCSQAECPALLRTDCVQWFAELDREVPSLVISVHGGSADVSSATVRIDGQPVAQALNGQPLELDPGRHLVEVLPVGQAALSREIVLAASEKARLLVFELPTNAPSAVTAPVASPPRPMHRPVPKLTWVLSGTALAALSAGSIVGGFALAERNKLERKPDSGGCAPYCSDAQVAPVHHLTLTADVLFGVAVASGAAAALSYFLRPEVPVASGRLELDFGVTPGSASLGLRGAL